MAIKPSGRRSTKGVIALILLALFIPFVRLMGMHIVTGFTDLFVINRNTLDTLWFAWKTFTFGESGAMAVWRIFPMDSYYHVLNIVFGITPSITHSLFLYLISLLGFGSFYLASRELFPGQSRFVYLLGSFAFTFNVYSMLNLSSTFMFALCYYALPLQIFLTLKALRSSKMTHYVILLALVNFATFGVNLAIAAIATLIILLTVLVELFAQGESKKFLRLMKFGLAVSGATLLLIAWWLLPMLGSVLGDKKSTGYTLASETFNGLDSTPQNILRYLGDWSFFGGYKGEPYHVFSPMFKENPLIIATSYVPMALVLVGIVYFVNFPPKQRNAKIYIWFFIVLVIVLAPVIGNTNDAWVTSGAMQWIFDNVPYAMAFRSTYKFMGLFVLCATMIQTALLGAVIQRWSNQGDLLRRRALITSFAALVFINSAPMWIGNIYDQKVQIARLPEYWEQTASFVNEHVDQINDRILLLPDQYFPVFSWDGERKTFPSDFTEIIFKPAVTHGTCRGCTSYYASELLKFIFTNLSEQDAPRLLGLVNISHLLQRDDYDYEYYNQPSPQQMKETINSYAGVRSAYENGPLHLYSMPESNTTGRIYSPERVDVVESFEGLLSRYRGDKESSGKNAFATTTTIGEQDISILTKFINQYIELFRPDASVVNNGIVSQRIDIIKEGEYELMNNSTSPMLSSSYTLRDSKNNATREIKPAQVLQLERGQYTLEADFSKTGRELVANGNFSDGLWQSEVGNCSFENPNAKLSMEKVQVGNGGKLGVQLSADSDMACLHSEKTAIDGRSNYVLSLDYRIIQGDVAKVCAWDGSKCLNRTTDLRAVSNSWQHLELPVTPSPNSKYMQMYLYAPAKLLDKQISKVQYSDISLRQISKVLFDAALLAPHTPVKAPQISINSVKQSSPTNISISAGAAESGVIVYQDAFNPGWQLFVNNGAHRAELRDHFVANAFSNGWYIDVDKLCKEQKLCKQNADGTYDMELVAEFTPQRWFYIGLIISGTTLVLCLGYLGWYGLRKYRRRRQPTHPTTVRPPRRRDNTINLRDS